VREAGDGTSARWIDHRDRDRWCWGRGGGGGGGSWGKKKGEDKSQRGSFDGWRLLCKKKLKRTFSNKHQLGKDQRGRSLFDLRWRGEARKREGNQREGRSILCSTGEGKRGNN